MTTRGAGEIRLRKVWYDLRRHALPEHDVTCSTRNGLLTFSSKDGSVGRRLYSHGEWSWEMLGRVRTLLVAEGVLGGQGNDLLVNVGANIGSVLVPLVRDGGFRRGIGFEPNAHNARYLRKNVEQNGLADTVVCHECGLSDVNGASELELSPDNMGDHRIRTQPPAMGGHASFREGDRSVAPVQLRRLDDVLIAGAIATDGPSLIWVDIQGHEGHFLLGAPNTLALGWPMVMEIWPYGIRRAGMSAEQFCGLIGTYFDHYFIDEDGRWMSYPIRAFAALYDKLDVGTGGADVIFLGPSRVSGSRPA